jgi:signal transduction histidine kinase
VSTQPTGFTSENLEFLTRLRDHAAIAISNAQLYAKVQAANKAKSEFVSAAAHELKNPLTSIKGYSDLLEAGSMGPVSEGQADFLRTIRTNAERMRTLVSDLQDITRIEAGQLLLEIGEASIKDLIQEVVMSFDAQISKKEQIITIDFGENLPQIRCDNTRMVQILTNLISNAHKYSPAGGRIVVKAGMAEQSLESAREVSFLQVSVADEGYGISEKDQKLIFEQFFRSEDSQIRQSTGTGLGLSITKKLVELQGGKLWFDSQHGEGTTFYFTVPVIEPTG